MLALGLLTFVALIAYFGRDGYADADDNGVSLLDAFYYATVSVTTTGYGDIRPESASARLISTLLVTPARVLFLIVLVGTTLEVLADRTRAAYLLGRWRSRVTDHVIICGFGTKGRSAARSLLARGTAPEDIVVIDEDPFARAAAQGDGFVTVAGNATRSEVLKEAGIDRATAVVVAPNDDATAVLTTLTAREHHPGVKIVAAVREEENAHLLRQGGADSVIVSSGSAGRLLGMATHAPKVVEVLEDLLSIGDGLDLLEREVEASECGPTSGPHGVNLVVAVHRGDDLLRFDDPAARVLEPGDRIVYLCSREEPRKSEV